MIDGNSAGKGLDEQEILEELIRLMVKDLRNEGGRFKVAELLKTLEIRRKLAPKDDREQVFWDMIERIRQDELPNSETKRKAISGEEPKERKKTVVKRKKKTAKAA